MYVYIYIYMCVYVYIYRGNKSLIEKVHHVDHSEQTVLEIVTNKSRRRNNCQ